MTATLIATVAALALGWVVCGALVGIAIGRMIRRADDAIDDATSRWADLS